MKLHIGRPSFPTALEANTGTIKWNKDGEQEGRTHFLRHPVARWFGLSQGHRWFFGVILFEKPRQRTEAFSEHFALPSHKEGGR